MKMKFNCTFEIDDERIKKWREEGLSVEEHVESLVNDVLRLLSRERFCSGRDGVHIVIEAPKE